MRVLAIDQGTSGTKAAVVEDKSGINPVGVTIAVISALVLGAVIFFAGLGLPGL